MKYTNTNLTSEANELKSALHSDKYIFGLYKRLYGTNINVNKLINKISKLTK